MVAIVTDTCQTLDDVRIVLYCEFVYLSVRFFYLSLPIEFPAIGFNNVSHVSFGNLKHVRRKTISRNGVLDAVR